MEELLAAADACKGIIPPMNYLASVAFHRRGDSFAVTLIRVALTPRSGSALVLRSCLTPATSR
jgi:hypothetical protein